MKRLHLAGDDEVLDLLADLSRHLDYFEVARLDRAPATLAADDHVVLAFADPRAAEAELARVRLEPVGLVLLVPEPEGASPGARAILAAAELVRALHPSLTSN
jgi:hypothetical protein